MRLGFTLIELLVTIVLFSLLLATSLYSFRFVSLNIRNINNTNPKMAMNYNILRDSIGSIYPYIDTEIEEKDFSKRFNFYFNANKQKCRFISTTGIFYKGLTLIELSIEENKLLYKEGKIFDKKIDYRYLNKIVLNKSIKLFSEIKDASFSFLNKGKVTSTYLHKLPEFIFLHFVQNKRNYDYKFKIKAHNKLRLEKIIFRHLERR